MKLVKTCFHDMPNGGTAKRNRAKSGKASDLRGGGGGGGEAKPKKEAVWKPGLPAERPEDAEFWQPSKLTDSQIDSLEPTRIKFGQKYKFRGKQYTEQIEADLYDGRFAVTQESTPIGTSKNLRYGIRLVDGRDLPLAATIDFTEKNRIKKSHNRESNVIGAYASKSQADKAVKELLKQRLKPGDWGGYQEALLRADRIAKGGRLPRANEYFESMVNPP